MSALWLGETCTVSNPHMSVYVTFQTHSCPGGLKLAVNSVVVVMDSIFSVPEDMERACLQYIVQLCHERE